MNRTHVSCTINGDEVDFLCDPGESLLNALRDEVGLTGVKEGCGTGDCGACSVMLDERVTCACLIFAPEVEGASVVTIEGLSGSNELHPLQQCFLEGAALQCGVCTPGFLVAAKALLDKNPNPTETEVRYALAGNLCRCTGYDKIIRAVLEAADGMRRSEGAQA
jgi:carbon-monoxide dehydrogenase small subunit